MVLSAINPALELFGGAFVLALLWFTVFGGFRKNGSMGVYSPGAGALMIFILAVAIGSFFIWP